VTVFVTLPLSAFSDMGRRLVINGCRRRKQNLCESDDKDLTYHDDFRDRRRMPKHLFFIGFNRRSKRKPKYGTAIASYLAGHLRMFHGFATVLWFVNAFTALARILRQAFVIKSACYQNRPFRDDARTKGTSQKGIARELA
jgi:hypothetical protein